jgi:hypothetical protein
MARAMDPARLTKFMDNPGVGTGIGPQFSRASTATYDPMTSWDGMSENPNSFSKLEKGPRHWYLEDHADGGNVTGQAGMLEPSIGIPRTDTQLDADGDGYRPDSRVNDPSTAEDTTVHFNQRFCLSHVEAPKIIAVKTPASMNMQGLLTPAQRREIMEFEKYNLQAKKTKHSADLQAKRREQILRCRHPQGCMINEFGFYQEQETAMQMKRDRAHQHAAVRAEEIAKRQSSTYMAGRRLIAQDDSIKAPSETKFAPSKAGISRRQLNTHKRIFEDDPRKDKPERTQHLRNQDLGGKNFDITAPSNGVVYARSDWPEKSKNPGHINREAHPSIIGQKLERYNQYHTHLPGTMNSTISQIPTKNNIFGLQQGSA